MPSSEFAQSLSQQNNRVVEEPAAANLTKGKNISVFDMDTQSDDFDKIAVGRESSDTDDFVAPKTRSGKKLVGAKRKAPSKKGANEVNSGNILSNVRAPKKSRKLRMPVEHLRPPGPYPHLRKARLLREFMLSKFAREKYKE